MSLLEPSTAPGRPTRIRVDRRRLELRTGAPLSADQIDALHAAALRDLAVAARFTEAVTRGELCDTELAGVTGGGTASLDPMLCPTGQCPSMYGVGCA